MSRAAPIPTATYRLQVHAGFTLGDAADLVGYLDSLGVSHVYLSPIGTARRGSSHGYDVVDPTRVGDELGGEEAFVALAGRLEERGMGVLLDVVPNHMCASGENRWWTELLAAGPAAASAPLFDVDWTPDKPELRGRVLLPLLGDHYGRVLERGELRPARREGRLEIDYYDQRVPLSPLCWPAAFAMAAQSRGTEVRSAADELRERLRGVGAGGAQACVERCLAEAPALAAAVDEWLASLTGTPGDPESWDRLDVLLDAQPWRLAFWRTAADEVNYRRFFDVNDLVALRTEEPAAFDLVHRLPLRLVREGLVDGLRVDHVDGLRDPASYLEQLREAGVGWLVVEKILTGSERLPDWPVDGTTGYEFANLVGGLFVRGPGAAKLRREFAAIAGEPRRLADIVVECKRLILRDVMASELSRLAAVFDGISERDRRTRDFTRRSIETALGEVIACFPTYRTYVAPTAPDVDAESRARIDAAVGEARRRNPEMGVEPFAFVASVLRLELPDSGTEGDLAARREALLRFQQLTGPVMAKGFEDTACYRYVPLGTLAEVGGRPDGSGTSVKEFHTACAERQQRWPRALSATSTHDTKRDEDVRARLAVLSECPREWTAAVTRWRRSNVALRSRLDGAWAPDGAEEWLAYQTLVGTWPGAGADPAEPFVERLRDYVRKALREAKRHSGWLAPDERYESAVDAYLLAALTSSRTRPFREDLAQFAGTLRRPGALGSVAQAALKAWAPGVPDFYQGLEVPEYSLVDPDNRREVDFERRRSRLSELDAAAERDLAGLARRLLAGCEDGALKQFVVSRALRHRRGRPETFVSGDYRPVPVRGARRGHAVAFARSGPTAALVVVGRFFRGLPDPPVGPPTWSGTGLDVAGLDVPVWRDLLTGRSLEARGGLALDAVFATLPLALLVSE